MTAGRPTGLGALRRNFGLALGGSVTVAVLGLVRTAVLARALGVTDFGRLLVVISVFQFAALFLDLRLGDVILRHYAALTGHDRSAADALVWVGLGLTALLGATMGLAILAGAGPIARGLFADPDLAPALRAFVAGGALIPLEVCASSVLRLQDRFGRAVAVQVVAASGSLVALLALDWAGALTVTRAATVLGLALVFHALTVGAVALAPAARGDVRGLRDAAARLRPSASTLRRTAVQVNVAGYLKSGDEQGLVFVLGVVAGPDPVAAFGLARQLVTPMRLVQSSASQAAAPRIVELDAAGSHRELLSTVRSLVRTLTIVGVAAVAVGVPLAPFAVDLVAGAGFDGAVMPLQILVVAAAVSLLSVPFYPLALATGRLRRRNAVVALRFVYLALVAVAAPTAAWFTVVILAGTVTTRVLNDTLLVRELRDRAGSRAGAVG